MSRRPSGPGSEDGDTLDLVSLDSHKSTELEQEDLAGKYGLDAAEFSAVHAEYEVSRRRPTCRLISQVQ